MNPSPSADHRTDVRATRGDAGLTLIELLVVVFLLGLLAQAAVLASAGALEEAQQQTTQQTLAQLEIALLGQPQRLDSLGRPNYGGFVADVGGLPVHRGAPASATPADALAGALRELWMRPDATDPDGLRALRGFSLQTSALDPGVRLACGWRGPYVRLGVGKAALRDGWGNAYLPYSSAGQPTVPGGAIAAVVSFGADATAAGTGYAADLSLVLEAEVSAVSPVVVPARHNGRVDVDVNMTGASGGTLVVRLFGPVAGELVVLDQFPAAGASEPFTAGSSVAVQFDGVSIGPRVLRAYRTTGNAPATTEPVVGPTNVSPVLPITVEPFAIQPLQLTLQGT